MSDKHIDEVIRRRHHRSRVGRHQGTQQSAAALVGVDVLRHDRLGARLHHRLSGLAADQRRDDRPARLFEPRRLSRHELAAARGAHERTMSTAIASKSRRRDPAPTTICASFAVAAGSRRLQGQLRAVPRLGRAGLGRLSRTSTTTTGCGAAALDQIHQTIAHGIRFAADAETRASEMPAFGEMSGAASRSPRSATFVASLSGHARRARTVATPARQVFAENCAACHGEDGKGNRELGAPDLTDAIWLYGSGDGGDRRPDQGAEARRHAGLGGAARRYHDQGARDLRPFARRRRVAAGGPAAA